MYFSQCQIIIVNCSFLRKVIFECSNSLNSATALSTSPIISVEFLYDPGRILDDLGITVGNLLSERVNNVADPHLLELLPALLVHTQVSNREQSDSSG